MEKQLPSKDIKDEQVKEMMEDLSTAIQESGLRNFNHLGPDISEYVYSLCKERSK